MNTITNNSFLDKAHNPYLQAAIVLALGFAIMLLAKVINSIGIIDAKDAFPWTIATSFILFFAIFNSVFSLASKDMDAYLKKSILAFAALALFSGLLAYLFSGISIQEAGEYKWIFTVFVFCYLVFMSMMGFMKRIVNFAQNEEWTKPRRRPGKRR